MTTRPHLAASLLAGALIASAVSPAHAAVFSLNGPSPQAVALGGSGVAVATDGTALWYNPAGLASVDTYQFGLSQNRMGNFSFLNYNLAHAAMDLGRWGSAAVALRTFSTQAAGSGEKLSTETTLSLAHGFTLLEDTHSRLDLGWTAHFYSLQFGTTAGTYAGEDAGYVGGIDLGSATAVGIDVGVRASLEDRTTVAAVLRNANRPSIGETDRVQMLERVLLAGSYAPYPGVLTTAEIELESGSEPARFRTGLEYAPLDELTLRVGTGSDPVNVTGGFLFKFRQLGFEYAFGSHPILPASHIFGLRAAF